MRSSYVYIGKSLNLLRYLRRSITKRNSRFTRKEYQDALNHLKEREYSVSTWEEVHRTRRMICWNFLKLVLIKRDPTEFAYLKKEKKTIEQLEEEEIPKYLEKEELALFLKTAKEQGLVLDYLIFLILSYTLVHVGELVVLKWKNIDYINQTISITKTITTLIIIRSIFS